VLILYLYPIVLAIYEHYTWATRLCSMQWIWGLTACCGLVLILGIKFDQISFSGIGLAMLAMLASVVITVTNVKVSATVGSLVSNLYMSLWGLLIFSLVLLLVGGFSEPQTTTGWVALLGNGAAYCIAWVAFFSGARILGATRASMITLVEPPIAALVAWLVFGETFTALQWVGFATVLGSLFMFEMLARSD
jgi:drug/metabolite transporter (DMT)-like permease